MKIRSMLPSLRLEDRHPIHSIRQEIDSLFDNLMSDLKLPEMSWTRTDFSPRIDVSETDKEVLISAELPGVEEKDIEVTVSGDQLVIKGEKKSEVDEKSEKEGRSFHRVERSYGSFQRAMTLPFAIDGDKVQANFKDGVLRLSLTKPAEVQKSTKRIAIGTEKPAAPKKAA